MASAQDVAAKALRKPAPPSTKRDQLFVLPQRKTVSKRLPTKPCDQRMAGAKLLGRNCNKKRVKGECDGRCSKNEGVRARARRVFHMKRREDYKKSTRGHSTSAAKPRQVLLLSAEAVLAWVPLPNYETTLPSCSMYRSTSHRRCSVIMCSLKLW